MEKQATNKAERKYNKHVNFRLDEETLDECIKIADEWNRSLSYVIRAMIYMTKKIMLEEIKEWMHDDKDKRTLNDILKGGKNNG